MFLSFLYSGDTPNHMPDFFKIRSRYFPKDENAILRIYGSVLTKFTGLQQKFINKNSIG